jgi:hypothetical protein
MLSLSIQKMEIADSSITFSGVYQSTMSSQNTIILKENFFSLLRTVLCKMSERWHYSVIVTKMFDLVFISGIPTKYFAYETFFCNPVLHTAGAVSILDNSPMKCPCV